MCRKKLTQHSLVGVISVALCIATCSVIAQDVKRMDYGTVLPLGSASESFVFDPSTGDYTLIYKAANSSDDYEYLVRLVYEPATKIDPVVISRFKAKDDRAFIYRYRIKNGKSAKQSLEGILMFVRQANTLSQLSPRGWSGQAFSINPLQTEGEVSVSWYFRDSSADGLAPGSVQDGFVFESVDLPGVGNIRLTGAVKKIVGYAGGGIDPESEVGKQFDKVTSSNFISYPVAIPKILAGNPYNGATVLDALRTHITKDIVELKLVEPTLATQLDRSLQAAADAIRRNTPKAAKEHLKDAMSLLKKDHPDCDKEDADDKDDGDDKNTKGKTGSIDRLAARVIAFDIKYVEKRLKDSTSGM